MIYCKIGIYRFTLDKWYWFGSIHEMVEHTLGPTHVTGYWVQFKTTKSPKGS